MKQQEMYDIIGELNACGAKREIIQIAKKDMENGVDGEKVLDKKNADAVSKDGSGYHYSCHSVDDFGDASDYSSGFVSGSVSVSSSASGYDFERTQETEKRERSEKIGQDYRTVMQIEGRNVPVLVEHMKVKNRAGFLGRIGKKMFGNSKYMKIIRAAVANRLNLEQMVQVKNSVCKGLLTNEILDIINSGFDAEEMELAVEIILAEKSYSMNEEYSSIEAEKESGKCF